MIESKLDSASWPTRDWTIFMEAARREYRASRYDQATERLHVALALAEETEAKHPHLGLTYWALGAVSERKREWQMAEEYYRVAAETLGTALGPTHPVVRECLDARTRLTERRERRAATTPIVNRRLGASQRFPLAPFPQTPSLTDHWTGGWNATLVSGWRCLFRDRGRRAVAGRVGLRRL